MPKSHAVPTLLLLVWTIAGASAFSACKSGSEKASESAEARSGPVPVLQFGVLAEVYEKEDSQEYPYGDDDVMLRSVRTFGIQDARVYHDPNGSPAVLFVIADAEKDEFRRWTGSLVGRELALIVDGKVVAMPKVKAALPGAGIVFDETKPWSVEDAQAVAERLRKASKAAGN